MKSYILPRFQVERDDYRCIRCEVCARQCNFDVHRYDEDEDQVFADESKCCGCLRCVTLCPTRALVVRPNPTRTPENYNWTMEQLMNAYKQAETGGVLLTGMGCDRELPIYWDRIVLDASQVTNPSIDPLREPMELRTYLGAKPDRLEMGKGGAPPAGMGPQLELETPMMFSAISYGAISFNTCEALARAAAALLCDPGKRDRMRSELAQVRAALSTGRDPFEESARLIYASMQGEGK